MMKINKTVLRVTSFVLAGLMVATSLVSMTGCGKEEPVETDTVTNIGVTSKELSDEAVDETTEGHKNPEELSAIVGYQSFGGDYFLTLQDKAGKGTSLTSVQVDDKNLFDAYYTARQYIYVEATYSSISKDDNAYDAYATGLLSLGSDFYKFKDNIAFVNTDAAGGDVSAPTEDTSAINTIQPITSEAPAATAEAAETTSASETTTAAAETTSAATDETTTAAPAGDDSDVMTIDELKNGGLQDDAASAQEKAESDKLKDDVTAYMAGVTLSHADKILAYTIKGELLGSMTADKLNDYTKACSAGDATKYGSNDGIAYVSEMVNGVTYAVQGARDATAENKYLYTVKDDINTPVVVTALSEDASTSEYLFEHYLPTPIAQADYYSENQYAFSASQSKYNIRVDRLNSDADLVPYMAQDKVLSIDNISDQPTTVKSEYAVILNNTDQTVNIVTDTKDTYTLGAKQAVGVHRNAYTSITYTFAGGTDSTQTEAPASTETVSQSSTETQAAETTTAAETTKKAKAAQ